MDPTLRAILGELFVYSQQVDALRARVQELERQIAQLQAQPAAPVE